MMMMMIMKTGIGKNKLKNNSMVEMFVFKKKTFHSSLQIDCFFSFSFFKIAHSLC